MPKMMLMVLFWILAGAVHAQNIMPLSEIKPGMRGYGLTVFHGTKPEKFDFKVQGIYTHGPDQYIIVLLSGGPRADGGERYVEQAQVVMGMSGSPLFIDGKLIGALSGVWGSQKIPQAEVMPIENMLKIKLAAKKADNKFIYNGLPVSKSSVDRKTAAIKGGETYCTCEVWDERNLCVGYIGNVTFVDPVESDLFYGLGHSATSIKTAGTIDLPFWKGSLVAIIPRTNESKMLVEKVGAMLGSVTYNSRFGQLGKIGVSPKFFPVSIILENGFSETERFNYFFAYTSNTGSNLAEILAQRASSINHLFDVEENVRIETLGGFVIYYKNTMEKVFQLGSGGAAPTSEIGLVFNKLVTEELKPEIKKIEITLKAIPRRKVLKLNSVASDGTIEAGSDYTSLTLAVTGNSQWETLVALDKKYFDKSLLLARGREIAVRILADSNQVDSDLLKFLNSIVDWDALYLYFDDSKNTSGDVLKSGQWRPISRGHHIIGKISPPGGQYRIEGSLEFSVKKDK